MAVQAGNELGSLLRLEAAVEENTALSPEGGDAERGERRRQTSRETPGTRLGGRRLPEALLSAGREETPGSYLSRG